MRMKAIKSWAAVLVLAGTGCLPVDTNTLGPEQECEEPNMTAERACAAQGLIAVDSCWAEHTTCEVMRFDSGCGDIRETLCASEERECGERQTAQEVCAAQGLVPATRDECGLLEPRPVPPCGTIEFTEEEEMGEQGDDVGAFRTKCLEEFEGETDAESEGEVEIAIGYDEEEPGELPPPHPDCVELVANEGCEGSRTVLCKEPDIVACPFSYAPVCGVDGRTYANDCVAGDVEIAHEGECVRDCPAVWQPVCGVDGRTYGNSCEAGDVEIAYEGECERACTDIWEPVCGVDGQTYSNECYAGHIEIAHDGECERPQLGSCIDEGFLDTRSHVRLDVEYESVVAGHFEDGTEMYLPVEPQTLVDVTIEAGFWFPVAQPQRTPHRIAERMLEVIEVKLEASHYGETEMLMRDDTLSRSYSERLSVNRSYVIGQMIDAPINATVLIRIDGHAVCTLETGVDMTAH